MGYVHLFLALCFAGLFLFIFYFIYAASKHATPRMSNREHRTLLDYAGMKAEHEAASEAEHKRRLSGHVDEIVSFHEGRKRRRMSSDKIAEIDRDRVREVNQFFTRLSLGPRGRFGNIKSDGTVSGGFRRVKQFTHHDPFPQVRTPRVRRLRPEKKDRAPRTKVPLRTEHRVRTRRDG